MVPRLLSQRPFKGGIKLAPGNDISNLAPLDRNEQYTMAAQSARNIVGVAERALKDNSTLEKLVMVEYPPRADNVQLNKITQHANNKLRESVDRSEFKGQIVIGNMDKLKFNNKKDMIDRFGPQNQTSWYDGVHFRGNLGKKLYTESIIAAVNATSSISESRYVTPRNTLRPRNQQGILPTPTYNKFETLSN